MESLRMNSYPSSMECDFCSGRKAKAIKSCLVCLASFCETHLQPHYQSPAFKKHKLVEASRRLQEQICSRHDKLLEVYCRTDQQCICTFCLLDEHKGHDTVSAEAGRAEKQTGLTEMCRTSFQRIQSMENKLEELRKAVRSHKHSAQVALEETEIIFTDLIRSILKRHQELKQMIKAQEKVAVSQAEDVMMQMETELTELKKRNTELEKLSHVQDPIGFLQIFQFASVPPGPAHTPTLPFLSLHPYKSVINLVSRLRDKLEEFCKDDFEDIITGVTEMQIISPDEHKTREEFQKYFSEFTLDPDTANNHLCLSESHTLVTCREASQWYPYHAERFDNYWQVLCSESVCGRCYWEVEWRGHDGVSVAVSYKDISRKGNYMECVFGSSDRSWRLLCTPFYYSFYHRGKEYKIPVIPRSYRIGVYVDHKAGTLSFYSISDTMKLLHKVHAKFTQPLYPGFVVCKGSSVKLCCFKNNR